MATNLPLYSKTTGLPLYSKTTGLPMWGDPDNCGCCGMIMKGTDCPYCDTDETPRYMQAAIAIDGCDPDSCVPGRSCAGVSVSGANTTLCIDGGDSGCSWDSFIYDVRVRAWQGAEPVCDPGSCTGDLYSDETDDYTVDITRSAGLWTVRIEEVGGAGNVIFDGTLATDDCLTGGEITNTVDCNALGPVDYGKGTVTITPVDECP